MEDGLEFLIVLSPPPKLSDCMHLPGCFLSLPIAQTGTQWWSWPQTPQQSSGCSLQSFSSAALNLQAWSQLFSRATPPLECLTNILSMIQAKPNLDLAPCACGWQFYLSSHTARNSMAHQWLYFLYPQIWLNLACLSLKSVQNGTPPFCFHFPDLGCSSNITS